MAYFPKSYLDTLYAAILVPTAVKTSAYTAAVSDFVPGDVSSAGFTVTLPNAPADKSQVAVEMIAQSGTNAITVACAGSDVFDKTGGTTSKTMSGLFQGIILQYSASGHIWYELANRQPKAYLDTLYVTLSTATTKGDLLVATGSGAITRIGVGSDTQVLTADSAQTPGVKWATPASGSLTYRALAANGTLANSDDVVEYTASGFTITLHDATTATKKRYDIHNTSTGNLSFATTSAQTLAGSTSGTFLAGTSYTVFPNGTNWIIL